MADRDAKADARLQLQVKRLGDILDRQGGVKDELAREKKLAEGGGYDIKALLQVVQERRRGSAQREEQLEFELIVDTYREGVGLTTKAGHDLRRAAERLTENAGGVTIAAGGSRGTLGRGAGP